MLNKNLRKATRHLKKSQTKNNYLQQTAEDAVKAAEGREEQVKSLRDSAEAEREQQDSLAGQELARRLLVAEGLNKQLEWVISGQDRTVSNLCGRNAQKDLLVQALWRSSELVREALENRVRDAEWEVETLKSKWRDKGRELDELTANHRREAGGLRAAIDELRVVGQRHHEGHQESDGLEREADGIRGHTAGSRQQRRAVTDALSE